MTAIDPDVFLPATAPTDDEAERAHFRISGPREADWAMRKLAKIRYQRAEQQQLYTDELVRLTEWRDAAGRSLDRDETYFTAILRNWHEEQLAADPKAKTIQLPSGRLAARQSSTSISITDEDALLQFARQNHPSWIRTTESVSKTTLREATRGSANDMALFDANGERVPGVEVFPGAVSYKAEPA